jgi:hypothetical protein
MKVKAGDTIYTKVFKEITWGGNIDGSARYLELVATQEFKCSVGDKIELITDEDISIFAGRVFTYQIKTDTKMINIKAYDNAIYLNKNRFVKNFYNKYPSEIVKEICGEIALEVGELPADIGIQFSFPALNRTGYEILLSAYTLQHRKDGKIYSIVSNDEKIEVVEQGTLIDSITLSSQTNIIKSQYSESIEDMINQMIVYQTENENIQIKDKVQNEEDIKKYGVFQSVIQYTEDNKALLNPQEMLKGLKQEGRLRAIGDVDLVSGYTVAVEEPHTQLVGQFLISEDRHVWTNTSHLVDLTLAFENVMNKVQFEEYKEKAEKKKKTKKSTKSKTQKTHWSVVEGEGQVGKDEI